jgi:hypothetical protein
LFCCAAVATFLGIFAVGGEWLGVWEPLTPVPVHTSPHAAAKPHQAAAKRHRVRKAHKAPARTSRSRKTSVEAEAAPEPPVPARTAFIVAALAAALAALTTVPRSRILNRVLRGLDSVGSPVVPTTMRRHGERSTIMALGPRRLHGINSAVFSPLARHVVLVGGKVVDIASSTRRRSLDRIKSVEARRARSAGAAMRLIAPALHTVTMTLVREASAGGQAVQALFAAATLHLRDIREWTRPRPGVAPFLVSILLGITVGWLVGTH